MQKAICGMSKKISIFVHKRKQNFNCCFYGVGKSYYCDYYYYYYYYYSSVFVFKN